MTDYNTMQAGKELDALISEKVMGWHQSKKRECWEDGNGNFVAESTCGWTDGDSDCTEDRCAPDCLRFKPSISIADAWKVVEHLYPKTVVLTMSGVSIYADDLCQVVGHDGKVVAEERGQEVSLAICRAALKLEK